MDLSRVKTARPVARLKQGRNDWYKIEAKARPRNDGSSVEAEVWIYDEIGYWGVTAQDFVRDLNATNADAITLHINSPGGDVFDGLAIYNVLKQSPAAVNVQVDGLAASAASFIAMAGNTVQIARNAQMMIHDAAGLVVGNAKDMQEMADLLDKASDNIADIYAQRAGGDVAAWRDRMKAETWYSGSEAVAAGLADGITGDAGEPVENTWDLSIYAGRGVAAPASQTTVADKSDGEIDLDSIINGFKEAWA